MPASENKSKITAKNGERIICEYIKNKPERPFGGGFFKCYVPENPKEHFKFENKNSLGRLTFVDTTGDWNGDSIQIDSPANGKTSCMKIGEVIVCRDDI